MNAGLVEVRWYLSKKVALSHQRKMLASTNKCPLINGSYNLL